MVNLPDRLDRCAHDGSAASAVYRLSAGCVARPDDRLQPVCLQHEGSLPDGASGEYSVVWEFCPVPW